MSICDESGMAADIGGTMKLSAWGFSERNLIWLLPCRDVTCGICDCLGTLSRACISSPNVVSDGVAAVGSVWGFPTAETFNSVAPYFLSLSQKWLAASPHPSCVSLSCLICFCRILSMWCCTVLEIVPVTLPGSWSSLSLPCPVFFHHHPRLSHPPDLWNLQDRSDCLW